MTSNLLPEEKYSTCLDCVKVRETILDDFPRDPFCEDEPDFYRVFPPRSIDYIVKSFNIPVRGKSRDPKINALKSFKTRLYKNNPELKKIREQEEFRKQGKEQENLLARMKNSEPAFIPPTTKQELILKQALSNLGYRIAHNEQFCGFYPDIRFLDQPYIIEVDGLYHLEAAWKKRDLSRTALLNERGYSVLRVSNDRVNNDLSTVLKEIEEIFLYRVKHLPIDHRDNKHLG